MKLYSVFIYYKWKSRTFRSGATQHYRLHRRAMAVSELEALDLVVKEALWLDPGIIDAWASVEDMGCGPQMIDTVPVSAVRINAGLFDSLPSRILSEGESIWGKVYRFDGGGLIPPNFLTVAEQSTWPDGFQLKVR